MESRERRHKLKEEAPEERSNYHREPEGVRMVESFSRLYRKVIFRVVT